MLTTKRFDYVAFDAVHLHPSVANHRPLNEAKVAHYAEDIQRNGLLEPLVVWERNPGEFFLVGGFHRYNAIRRIRSHQPDYFDRIDVRVVHGELDEMQALNLKLNADRLNARITDYFDAIIFMANANWEPKRIAQFLDKKAAWVEDILRVAPSMDPRIRRLLEAGELSWARAKKICQTVMTSPPGTEPQTLEAELEALRSPSTTTRTPKALTFRTAKKRLKGNQTKFRVTGEDLLALLKVMRENNVDSAVLDQVRAAFPGLLDSSR